MGTKTNKVLLSIGAVAALLGSAVLYTNLNQEVPSFKLEDVMELTVADFEVKDNLRCYCKDNKPKCASKRGGGKCFNMSGGEKCSPQGRGYWGSTCELPPTENLLDQQHDDFDPYGDDPFADYGENEEEQEEGDSVEPENEEQAKPEPVEEEPTKPDSEEEDPTKPEEEEPTQPEKPSVPMDSTPFQHEFGVSISNTLRNGAQQLMSNLEFAIGTTEKTISLNLDDAHQLNAELKSSFPNEYQQMIKATTNVALVRLDFGSIIKDVGLMATSTNDNLARSFRKLSLRKRYLDGNRMSASFDVKIWKYLLKSNNNDINSQLEKLTSIIGHLSDLSKKTAVIADDIDGVLKSVEVKIKKDVESNRAKMASLKRKAAECKCNFWQMLFTFGQACKDARRAKSFIMSNYQDTVHQLKAAEGLHKKLKVFEGIRNASKNLFSVDGTQLVNLSKNAASQDTIAMNLLASNALKGQLLENSFGDIDFVNDQAELAQATLTKLQKFAGQILSQSKANENKIMNALTGNH